MAERLRHAARFCLPLSRRATGGHDPFEIAQDGAFRAVVAVAVAREILEGCPHRRKFGDFPVPVDNLLQGQAA
jgi:hypothetical protein